MELLVFTGLLYPAIVVIYSSRGMLAVSAAFSFSLSLGFHYHYTPAICLFHVMILIRGMQPVLIFFAQAAERLVFAWAKIPGAGRGLCPLLAHASGVNPAILQANVGRAASRTALINVPSTRFFQYRF